MRSVTAGEESSSDTPLLMRNQVINLESAFRENVWSSSVYEDLGSR